MNAPLKCPQCGYSNFSLDDLDTEDLDKEDLDCPDCGYILI